jgi:hypothetical protein
VKVVTLLWVFHLAVNGELVEIRHSPVFRSFGACQAALPHHTMDPCACWPKGLR